MSRGLLSEYAGAECQNCQAAEHQDDAACRNDEAAKKRAPVARASEPFHDVRNGWKCRHAYASFRDLTLRG